MQVVHFVLSPQDLALHVSAPWPVYLAGETVELAVKAADARGQPLAVPLVLKVVEQVETAGPTEPAGLRGGERLVEERPLRTAADGSAHAELKLDRAGRYRLRVEGLDRFKTRVSAAAEVHISGTDDQIRLRILTDRSTYRVGDTAQVRLLWRKAGHRSVDPRRRADFAAAVGPAANGRQHTGPSHRAGAAPNFDLSVAAMSDVRPADAAQAIVPGRRFHSAVCPLVAQQELHVGLQWRRKGDSQARPTAVRPGDQLELTIMTSDVQGRPVPAELSVGLVQKSLLERANPFDTIDAVFRGPRRQSYFHTASSIVYTDVAAPGGGAAPRDALPAEAESIDALLTAMRHEALQTGESPAGDDAVASPGPASRPVARPHARPTLSNRARRQRGLERTARVIPPRKRMIRSWATVGQSARSRSGRRPGGLGHTPSLRKFSLLQSAYWNGAVVRGPTAGAAPRWPCPTPPPPGPWWPRALPATCWPARPRPRSRPVKIWPAS